MVANPKMLFPGSWRRGGRRLFDRLFCRRVEGLRRIGTTCGWSVIETRLKPGAEVLSGGVGQDISFEVDLVTRLGCTVAAFDPSPTGQATIERLAPLPPRLSFYPYGLSGRNGQLSFAPPEKPEEGSFRVASASEGEPLSFRCFDPKASLELCRFKNVELVKIDIEGSEYDFIEAMLAAGIKPAQLAVEFHHFLPQFPMSKTLQSIRQLRENGYVIVHKEQCDYLFVQRSVLR